jgi:ankyrin repeat protein
VQIHSSARYGDLEGVQRQLSRGVPVDIRSANGWEKVTPLMAAAKSKYAGVDMLELLVTHGADLHAVSDGTEQFALGLAAQSGNLEKVNYLLQAGTQPNFKTAKGYRALIHAVYCQRPAAVEIVKSLLAAGAKPNIETAYGETPFGVAYGFSNFEAVRVLIDAGADLKPLAWSPLMEAIALGSVDDVAAELQSGGAAALGADPKRPWYLALQVGEVAKAKLLLEHEGVGDSADLLHAVQKDHLEMVKWLLDWGADPNATDDYGHTVLMEAAQWGSTGCVRVLLDARADIHAQDHVQAMAISSAANADIARLLIEAGADIDFVDGTGYTVLKRAVERGDEDFVSGLLALGASTEAAQSSRTALDIAVSVDALEIVKVLLTAGANPNAQNTDRWFPLQHAQSIQMVQLLLDAGADIHLRDEMNRDALQEQVDVEVAEYLMKAGARVNPPNSEHGTPLLRAVERHDPQLMCFFLEAGADVNAATSWGQTALMEAAENSFAEGVRLLLVAKANIDASDENGRTALFHAAAPEGFTAYELQQKYRHNFGYVESDSVEVLQMLVRAKADINARDKQGMTPLMLAASCGRPARVQGLLDLGANLGLKDNTGLTALDNAKKHPIEVLRVEIIKLLSKKSV